MMNQQMELGIGNAAICRSLNRPKRRQTRAQWWFEQMREAVDKAFDWRTAPPARPQQIWLYK
ncbi:MAG: hypothetical protein U1F65_09960 [Verrucomicrobiota bacterium]